LAVDARRYARAGRSFVTLVVTGGTGFVLSNLVLHWLQSEESATCVVVDDAPWDAHADQFFAPVKSRLRFVQGDVRDPGGWSSDLKGLTVTHLIHGAALTTAHDDEYSGAQRMLDVNVSGTAAVLDWARGLDRLRRLIYVSSGSVYGDSPTYPSDRTVPEDHPGSPDDVYGLSKLAAEQLTGLFREHCLLDAVVVRLTSVYGPMDRQLASRSPGSVPYKVAQLAVAGELITVDSLDEGADWLHALDVARALVALLKRPVLRHRIYNIAYGEVVPVGELLHAARAVVADLHYEVVPVEQAAVVARRPRLGPAWGAYDTTSLTGELGWRPKPIRSAFQSYLEWMLECNAAAAALA